jgi:type IV secretion system protein VirD4
VKTDLVKDTISWRRRIGEVWVFDPAASTGLPASSWSPLEASTTWLGARRTAEALCVAGRAHQGTGLTDADFWYATAAKLLAPLLLAAARTGRGMSDVVRWVDEQELAEVAVILEAVGAQDALQAARATWRRDDRQRSSVYTTAETILDAFADPSLSVEGDLSEIDPHRLLDGGSHTLYVCAPAHEQQRLRPVFAALVTQMLTTAFDQVAARRGALDPPLLVVLDEAANVAPLAELDVLAATAAGHGIQLVTVWQDMAQISARYGERAATVVNNHRAKVVLSGISDPATLDHLSHLVGEEEVIQVSTTTTAEGSFSTTRSTSPRRLAPADTLRRIRPGHGVLIYGHLPPARLVLRPWFADRRLASRARRDSAASQPAMKLSLARRLRLSALRSTMTTLCHVPSAGRPRRTGTTIEGLTKRGRR